MTTITLDDYVKREKENLDAFASYWSSRSKDDATSFPLKLPIGDWDEQFSLFTDRENKDSI